MATVARLVGDLDIAEDAVQDACALAVERWPVDGVPASPRAWLVGVARHKALDRLRREARRPAKEAAATSASAPGMTSGDAGPAGDDELGLICAESARQASRSGSLARKLCQDVSLTSCGPST